MKIRLFKSEFFFKLFTLSFCIGWLVYVHLLNEIPFDTGDGIQHFNISQASWSEPVLFLNHWGKPFFILLTSPFSQFGFDGIVAFNIIVFGATILFSWKILNHFSTPLALQCLFPFVLISIFDYVSTLLSGLTEPLFSLAIIISTWLIIKQKWLLFAIVVSFVPFMRSEGQLVFILGIIILLYYRQFKHIPLLLSGFFIYAIIGYFIYHDFWWYFTMNPYDVKNHIYGKGPWNDYLLGYKNYLGNIGLFIFIFGSIRLGFLIYIRNWTEIQFPWLFFVYSVFFGILISHSYFWAMGINGSFGLTRITTQGMPSFLVINFYYLGKTPLPNQMISLQKMIPSALCVLIVIKNLTSDYFPVKVDFMQTQMLNAVEFLKNERGTQRTFFFHDPLFSFKMGGNSFFKNQPYVLYYCFGLKKDLGILIKPGDFLIRDSHFGPQEMGLPLSQLVECPEMVKVKEFVSDFQTEDRYNEVEGVVVYQYQPKKR
jgi:hypothetical protein